MFDMRRREFITLLGGAVTWPLVARAQQSRVYTIGVLTLTSPNPEPLLNAFREGLRDAGYVEGRNLRLEIRSASGRPDLQLEKARRAGPPQGRPHRHVLHADRVGGETGNARHSDRDGRRGRSCRGRSRREPRPAGRQQSANGGSLGKISRSGHI
jgi:hypothetical protein